jgi:hypothetical protein
MSWGLRVLPFAVWALAGCADLPSALPEQLDDPGPRDGSFDAALSFDGVNDYASTGTARFPAINRPQTQTLLVRVDEQVSGVQALLVLRLNYESGSALALEGGVPLLYNVWGDRPLAKAETALSLGRWHHLAAVLTDQASSLYVDGQLVGSGPESATHRTPTLAFLGSVDGSEALFRGQLDEVRVYDRAMNEDEIAVEAKGEHSALDPLVLYLAFNESGGARAYDRSGLGNHALLGDSLAEFMPTRVPAQAASAP